MLIEAVRTYVVDYSSLVEATTIRPTQRAEEVLVGMAGLATSGRLKCVSTCWDRVKKDIAIKAAFTPCRNILVVKLTSLGQQLRTILPSVRAILPFDAVDEDPDPWTLALAYDLGSVVVSEINIIRPLAHGCQALNLVGYDLQELITVEQL